MSIHIIKGDITKISCDAIVNAANSTLLGGGGVDGAIHKAAGPKLFEECKKIGGCDTGDVKVTDAYELSAKYIFHTVGPIYKGGNNHESALLEACYHNCMTEAYQRNIRCIAFPCISTGVYRFPKKEAAKIAYETVVKFLNIHEYIPEPTIYFVCYDEVSYQYYLNLQKMI